MSLCVLSNQANHLKVISKRANILNLYWVQTSQQRLLSVIYLLPIWPMRKLFLWKVSSEATELMPGRAHAQSLGHQMENRQMYFFSFYSPSSLGHLYALQ